jgi:hypothetical protein
VRELALIQEQRCIVRTDRLGDGGKSSVAS